VKIVLALLALPLTTAGLAPAAPKAPAPLSAAYAQIEGEWTVDLRPSLGDEPYTKPMVLHIAPDKSLTGTFYDSEILAGRAGTAQDRSCVAFRTTDGAGFYHSSACLTDGKMVGLTWSEGRNFVLPWTATRK
jgi:hypothetical protein